LHPDKNIHIILLPIAPEIVNIHFGGKGLVIDPVLIQSVISHIDKTGCIRMTIVDQYHNRCTVFFGHGGLNLLGRAAGTKDQYREADKPNPVDQGAYGLGRFPFV